MKTERIAVTPAKAGVQRCRPSWMPAFAGMTAIRLRIQYSGHLRLRTLEVARRRDLPLTPCLARTRQAGFRSFTAFHDYECAVMVPSSRMDRSSPVP